MTRFKPDIHAPTNSKTASNVSDTARHVFTGTRGATPYAAGAAALLCNWLRRPTGSIEPGQVYAQMILSGQNPYPFTNTVGAGPLELPKNGFAWWGKVTVQDRENVDIPIVINAASANTLEAALWWPESDVRIFGLVDLLGEGFGTELWVGSFGWVRLCMLSMTLQAVPGPADPDGRTVSVRMSRSPTT